MRNRNKPQLNIEIEDELNDRLEKAAKLAPSTKSDFVRQAINEKIRRMANDFPILKENFSEVVAPV